MLEKLNKMNIGKNIRIRRKRLKMTQEQLALEVNSDAGNLSRIENGKQNIPLDKIELYAKALNCKPSDLLVEQEQQTALFIPVGFIKIPFINGYQARNWNKNHISNIDSDVSEWSILPATVSSFSFAFRVEDIRMMPDIKIGDVLIIDPEITPEAGDIVLASKNDNEAILGKFRLRGLDDNGIEQFELQPLNDDFETLHSKRYSLRIIGVMTEHRRFRIKSGK